MSYNTFTGLILVKINCMLTQVFMYFKKNLQKKQKIEPGNPLSASLSFRPTGGNHIKIKYPSTHGRLFAKIKWKTQQICARIKKKCKKTKKIRLLDIITRFNT